MILKKTLGLLVGGILATTVWAQDSVVNPKHPETYTVVNGDTLWDISGKFLTNPWLWPEVWYVNPQIENPHLIYPGDLITLSYDANGRPVLSLKPGDRRGMKAVKLSPGVRATPLDTSIPTIPFSEVEPFVTFPLVTSKEEFEKYPYMVSAADEHEIAGAGDRVYVRGTVGKAETAYVVFRQGEALVDPTTKEVLGYEGIYVGTAEKVRDDKEVSTFNVIKSDREVRKGDRFVAVPDVNLFTRFQPKAADQDSNGEILRVFDGVTQIGQYNVVILNRGERENVQVGDVFNVWQTGKKVRDTTKDSKEMVQLPDEKAGIVMVFRTFEKVSYALVMRATRAMHTGDKALSPKG